MRVLAAGFSREGLLLISRQARTIDTRSGEPVGARSSLTDQVSGELREEILAGRLAPGQAINELDLASRYGVSKTPVREALRFMVQEGWIVVLPRKGYLVKPLALDDIREIFVLRRLLEPPMTAEAARRGDPRVIENLRQIIAEQADGDVEFDQLIRAASDFHIQIAQASHNVRAVRMVTSLIDEVRRLNHQLPGLEDQVRSITELEAHQRIVDALEQGDGEAAADLMRAHLVVAGRGMTEAFGDTI
jgi:DNA-binding GntR family transcriptional regulator